MTYKFYGRMSSRYQPRHSDEWGREVVSFYWEFVHYYDGSSQTRQNQLVPKLENGLPIFINKSVIAVETVRGKEPQCTTSSGNGGR